MYFESSLYKTSKDWQRTSTVSYFYVDYISSTFVPIRPTFIFVLNHSLTVFIVQNSKVKNVVVHTGLSQNHLRQTSMKLDEMCSLILLTVNIFLNKILIGYKAKRLNCTTLKYKFRIATRYVTTADIQKKNSIIGHTKCPLSRYGL